MRALIYIDEQHGRLLDAVARKEHLIVADGIIEAGATELVLKLVALAGMAGEKGHGHLSALLL